MEVFGAWCLILLALVTVKRSNRTHLPRTRTLWKQSHLLLSGYETKSPKLFPIFQTDRYGLDLLGSQTVVWPCWCTEGRTDTGVTFPMCLPCFFCRRGQTGACNLPPTGSKQSSYFESDPSFRQCLCSCQEPWLKMTDSVVVEGYARLREGKKVLTLSLFACGDHWSTSTPTWFCL